MTEEQKAICHQIAIHYGFKNQAIKAIEEMAELQKALAKILGCEQWGSFDEAAEELADVEIMVEQLRYFICGVYAKPTDDIIDHKLNRQLERMESENDAKK